MDPEEIKSILLMPNGSRPPKMEPNYPTWIMRNHNISRWLKMKPDDFKLIQMT